jgi:U3 small nucleolar RNA-associated protein 18
LFFLDAGPSGDSAALMPIAQSGFEKEESDAPAWDDSDDDRLMVSIATNPRLRKLRTFEGEDLISGREYTKRLRQQFQRLNPPPEWATIAEPPAKRRRRSSASSNSSNSDDDMDMDENLSAQPLARLLQSSNRLTKVSTKRGKLRPEVISIQRMKDIGEAQPSAVTSLQFHPEHPVILSAGLASTLYLHHISPTSLPTPNPQLMSVHVKHTPIHTSAFLGPTGDKIIFSGRRRYFHTWDLGTGTIQKVTQVYGHQEEQRTMERFKLSPCGRYMGLVSSSKKGGGIVNILDAHTTQWIAAARIEGRQGLADFAWWSDGEGLTIAGKGGEVGEYSMESKSFVALWQDDGAVGTSVLTLGGKSGQKLLGGDRWVVIGSSSGIVNVYDRKPWAENSVLNIPKHPEPTKVLKHLTTPVSHLHIRPDGQLLVMASRWKKDALKLVHLPSCTVYRNWPTSQTPLGRISAVAFSPDNDMLAVGNEQGKVKLWEIRD